MNMKKMLSLALSLIHILNEDRAAKEAEEAAAANLESEEA